MSNEKTGLFHLALLAPSAMPGAPGLSLSLGGYAPTGTVSGVATVNQGLAEPVCVSSVSGVLIHETVMPPGKSAVRIDLAGHPSVRFPPSSGIGPVILTNFKAILVLDPAFQSGTAEYEYMDGAGKWHRVTGAIGQS